MRRCLLVTVVLGLVSAASGCERGESSLRGKTVDSPDGKTYLVVDDDNGGGCGPIRVDGKIWKHATGKPGPITPGTHVIACGGEIEFEVPPGKVFHFDYWGP